jgi:hypothetical protein
MVDDDVLGVVVGCARRGLIFHLNPIANHTESDYTAQPCREPRRK